MLSQDEINALLSGMSDSSADLDGMTEDLPAASGPQSTEPASYENTGAVGEADALLSDTEKDAIGEIANISMGSAATTLYSLVNHKVNITTPIVSLSQWETMVEDYERPCVFIQIKYTAGLDGHNILILKEHDVKVITDLMMGGDGTNTEGDLSEIHLSAISEAMNQMMGASATSLATMLGKMIDISPPEATLVDLMTINGGQDIAPFLGGTFVKISFRMQIGELVDSTIMQLYPCDFARYLCNTFMNGGMNIEQESEPAPAPAAEAPAPAPAPMPSMPQPDMGMVGMGAPAMGAPAPDMNMAGMYPPYGMPMQPGYGMPPYGGMPMQPAPAPMAPAMNIQPAQFQSFTGGAAGAGAPANIDLIMDVALEVTVELGRTKKSISEVLDFTPGTIIELDKVAGEPVEVLVNGKMVARGEVVVIEESFGVRITEIIK
ncbi:MAG: flagellar motor switch phosphatase FliY [Lachnospiraceae bacterium]|nr:flagellar motor switch phosphatase FliY [Lachnospiraceae bacterium]